MRTEKRNNSDQMHEQCNVAKEEVMISQSFIINLLGNYAT